MLISLALAAVVSLLIIHLCRLQVTLTPGEQLMSRIINQSIAVCGRWCTVNDPLSWVPGAEEVRWLIQQQSVAARPAIYLQCLECRVQ